MAAPDEHPLLTDSEVVAEAHQEVAGSFPRALSELIDDPVLQQKLRAVAASPAAALAEASSFTAYATSNRLAVAAVLEVAAKAMRGESQLRVGNGNGCLPSDRRQTLLPSEPRQILLAKDALCNLGGAAVHAGDRPADAPRERRAREGGDPALEGGRMAARPWPLYPLWRSADEGTTGAISALLPALP